MATSNQLSFSPNIIEKEFREFIIEKNHPCIMANTVFAMNDYELHIHDGFGTQTTAKRLLAELKNYLSDYDFSNNNFKTFIAVFPDADVVSETEFENILWRQLQFIHTIDSEPWDPRVSNNPDDNDLASVLVGVHFMWWACIPKVPERPEELLTLPWFLICIGNLKSFEKWVHTTKYAIK